MRVQLVLSLKHSMVAGIVQIAVGDQQSIILKRDGSVWSAGDNQYGQLGHGSTLSSLNFVSAIMSDANGVVVGKEHSMVLKLDGSVWASGHNHYGQLGDGSTADKSAFVKVLHDDVIALVAGLYHSMALKQDGSVWATGRNDCGQLGDGTTTSRNSFVQVESEGVKSFATGACHSMILKEDGSVWGTGSNSFGQLGIGLLNVGNTVVFREVFEIDDVAMVAAGAHHSLLILHDGSIWATGRNLFGQLGDGSRITKNAFAPVITSGAKAVAAGHSYSMVLTQDGSVWATGSNLHGQLGDGSTTDKNAFVQVIPSNAKTICVVAGYSHSMILTDDDRVWATGWNLYGQLGDGSITAKSTFMLVAELGDNRLPPGDAVIAKAPSPGEKRAITCLVCSVQVFCSIMFFHDS